ncbi:expression site-associated gene 2 (ESAG2) protein, putative [Trypanosoma vivax Y486]|uniref:Expression site-associated gene 2 (ESAG2) protein, putative n=1 Tax=Trypanosoma vivax (strain Y486) TaxID=1055687 RepID=F9WL51_TRYVY|nr:expression site-associated gene 2 (ESAG2) protein, putative [Trypanosoma vivax Y486]|eukprot:CCD18237.1 expression site-associated gene 2 (ESAG2) protein, putative [Trypanosoma vivax Y486]
MLAAWRAVCLAALSAALAATLATGDDAGAGDTVRDFGLVCAVFRNVLQARGVAKAQKARAAEVALAIEHAWLGEAREDLEEDVVYSPANEAQTRKAKAKRLKGQAEELADKIDALSYSAILGDKGNNQPDKAEDKSNVLFGKIAGSGANKGFADAQSGAALSNDMMWLCNVAGATATDETKPFKTDGDNACPCTKDGAAATYLKSGEFWKKLKKTTGSNNAEAIAQSWTVAKRICLKGKEDATLTQDQKRKPLSAAHDLSTAVTRVMAAINTDGKRNPTKKFCLGQRKNSQTCDGNTHATACVCYDQHKGHIPWSDKIAEMETQLEALQDVMTQLDQLRTEAEGLNRTRAQEATRAAQAQEASQQKDAEQRAGNGTNTQNTTPEQRGNRKKRTAAQGENNDAQKAEVAGQGNTECGPAHPAWNTDTKTCSTTRRNAHVTAILTLLATALDAQDTRMAQQILQ